MLSYFVLTLCTITLHPVERECQTNRYEMYTIMAVCPMPDPSLVFPGWKVEDWYCEHIVKGD